MTGAPELRGSPGRPAWLGVALVAPALAVSALIIAYPFIRTLDLSVSDATVKTLGSGSSFVGLSNFGEALSQQKFVKSLFVTALFAGSSALLSVAAGLAVALLLAGPVRARGFWRAVCLVPYAAPVAATAFAWRWLLDYNYGAVNTLLVRAGLERVAWLTQPGLDLGVCVLFQVWRYFPFAMLLILARLRSIPPELYEAAAVDGAGKWGSFRGITWPQVAPLCTLLFLLRLLWTFNKFDDVYLLAGATDWTHVATIEMYNEAFLGSQRFGLAAAMAIIVLATFALIAVVVKGIKAWTGVQG